MPDKAVDGVQPQLDPPGDREGLGTREMMTMATVAAGSSANSVTWVRNTRSASGGQAPPDLVVRQAPEAKSNDVRYPEELANWSGIDDYYDMLESGVMADGPKKLTKPWSRRLVS